MSSKTFFCEDFCCKFIVMKRNVSIDIAFGTFLAIRHRTSELIPENLGIFLLVTSTRKRSLNLLIVYWALPIFNKPLKQIS